MYQLAPLPRGGGDRLRAPLAEAPPRDPPQPQLRGGAAHRAGRQAHRVRAGVRQGDYSAGLIPF